jgi:hypothetical protein
MHCRIPESSINRFKRFLRCSRLSSELDTSDQFAVSRKQAAVDMDLCNVGQG